MFDDYFLIVFQDGERVIQSKLRTDHFKDTKEALIFFIQENMMIFSENFRLVQAQWITHYFLGGEAQKLRDKRTNDSALTHLYGKTAEEIL